MKTNYTTQLILENLEAPQGTYGAVILNKEKFVQVLDEIDALDNLNFLKIKYWGNFIPQIPHQMMLRYTKKG